MGLFRTALVFSYFLIMSCANIFAQDIVVVNKPGKLSKQIKNATTVERLQITGILNSDDMAFLSQLPNLMELDLSNAKFEEYDRTAKQYKNQYIQRGKLNISGFRELKSLILPTEYNNYTFTGINVLNGALPKTAYLKIPAKCTFSSDTPEGIYFYKVEFTGETKKYWDKNKERQSSIFIDTLIVPAINDIACTANNHVLPFKIFTKKENKKILNRWNDDFDISILEQVDSLGKGVFWKSKLERITIPTNIKSIPSLCFYECENLKEVDLGEVTDISQCAFGKTNIERLKIPATVTDIEDYAFAFSNIKQLEFMGKYAPSIYHVNEYEYFKRRDYNVKVYYGGENLDFWRQCEFIIPQGSYQTFAIGEWAKFALKEKGEKNTHTITVEKAGTLATLFPEPLRASTDSLIIKGFLYDTDFEVIKQCKHLRFLDLSHSFVTISPETLKKSDEERVFLANYLAFVADAAKQQSKDQYNSGQKNLGKHLGEQLEAMTLKTLAEELKKETIKPNPQCQLHRNALEGLLDLKEVKLPLQLIYLPSCLAGKKYLEQVTLPPSLKSIANYAFSGCSNLKSIEVPSTVQFLGQYAFRDCKSIAKIDLSNTVIENILDNTFEGADALFEIHFPATLKSMRPSIFSQSDIFNKKGLIKLFFKTREIPKYFVVDSKFEIHIPKGSRAGWQNSNFSKHIIEE